MRARHLRELIELPQGEPHREPVRAALDVLPPPTEEADEVRHVVDARFQQLQLARASSSTSLATLPSMGSETSLASDVDELTCVICFERPTDATFVHGSTAHVCCCLSCAQSLFQQMQFCPMCRKPIESVLQLFFA